MSRFATDYISLLAFCLFIYRKRKGKRNESENIQFCVTWIEKNLSTSGDKCRRCNMPITYFGIAVVAIFGIQ